MQRIQTIRLFTIKHLIILFALFSFLAIPRTSFSQTYDDAIIAVVNDELITLQDLNNYIKNTYANFAAEGMNEKGLKQLKKELEANGIKRLIEDKLILSKANEIGLEINEKVVDDHVAEIKARYPSEEVFLKALVQNGANLSEIKKKVKDQLKIKYVIQHEVESKIFVNPQEVTEFYEANKKFFNKGERVNLQSIFIAFKEDKDAAKKKAKEAMDFIKQGIDFMETSALYSDTPSIGIVEKGQLIDDIEKIIFNLEPGQVSPIIEVSTGLYIFKLIDKMPPEIAPLHEVKDNIYKQLYQMKYKEEYTKWLNKLMESAYVEIKSK